MSIESSVAANVSLVDHASRNCERVAYPPGAQQVLSATQVNDAMQEISSWPGYQPSPLLELDTLAGYLNCGSIAYKDESSRFGLGSFKALGGAYAVLCLVADEYRRQHGDDISLRAIRSGEYAAFTGDIMVTTATDGNHGRSVAWGAANAGCPCRIYIHRDVSEGRREAMESFGAQVIRIDGDYDDSVRQCAAESAANGWHVVSDTSYEGYMDVPRNVMAGYTVMASEILKQNNKPFTHVIVQAGVGGLAAAVFAGLWMHYGVQRPRFIVVESQHAACWLHSVRAGEPKPVSVDTETVMAGLSCGEVSELAWQIMDSCVDDVVTLADDEIAPAMKLFADGKMSAKPIESGECGVPGALALMAMCGDENSKRQFGIDQNSRVLIFGCEGATDQQVYNDLLASVVE